MHRLSNLDSLNTSNVRVLNVIAGEWKMKIPKNDGPVWVDVRDLALGHVKAIEVSNAANKRFFVTAGHCSNKEMVDVIRRNFPDLVEKLPVEGNRGGDFPEGGIYGFDNQRAIDILGIQFRSFEESIVDTVKSLQSVLARA